MPNATIAVTVSAKVYTKTGDAGTSKTITGTRRSKSDLAFEVLGTIDELNASLGLLSTSKKKDLIKVTRAVQNDLFKIGSYFAGIKFGNAESAWLDGVVMRMEKEIDTVEKLNKPLNNFILPGGTFESAHLHYSRTVCRRLERVLVAYLNNSKDSGLLATEVYFNRLSDYFFVLARFYNAKGKKDLIWKSQ